MQIKEIVNVKIEQDFYDLPFKIYCNDNNWIAPMTIEVKQIFDAKTNIFYNNSTCKRWVLYDVDNQAVGRISAFYNPYYKNKDDILKVGGIGFFECINNQEAANLLFNTAKNFLQYMQCDVIDGPINLGERDKFWGLLIKGFNEPLYGMNYNPPYYKILFEAYGFAIYYEQYCYEVDLANWESTTINRIYERLQKNEAYKIVCFKKTQIEKFAKDFVSIYNNAWKNHHSNKTLTVEKALKLFKSMSPLIDENLIFFVYHNQQTVAFSVNLPNINKYFKNLRGLFGWKEKIKLYCNIKFSQPTKAVGMVFGIVEEHQSKGIDALMTIYLLNKLKASKYKTYELQWIGSFNKKMISFVNRLNVKLNRTFATYRIMTQSKNQFKQHPNI